MTRDVRKNLVHKAYRNETEIMESKAIMEIPMTELQKSGSHTSDNAAPSDPQGPKTNVSASVPASTARLWRVATIKQHGIGQLFGIPACENETGEEVMRKIQVRFGRRKFKQYLNKIFLLRSEAVFVGNISLVSLISSVLFLR